MFIQKLKVSNQYLWTLLLILAFVQNFFTLPYHVKEELLSSSPLGKSYSVIQNLIEHIY